MYAQKQICAQKAFQHLHGKYLLKKSTNKTFYYNSSNMRTEFTRPRFLFLYLSLGLLFTRRAIAINNKHPLSDLHTNALRKDFNDCMDTIENNNLKFHSCQGFSSIESCRCFFLKEVDHQCKSLGEKSSNYWYFEHQILTYCKNVHTTSYSGNSIQNERK